MSHDGLHLPIFLEPIFKEKIWGGAQLHTSFFSDHILPDSCGECWLLSSVPDSASNIDQGPHAGLALTTLINTYTVDLMGYHVYEQYGNTCPLLVKLIDAADDLSVQVHPDNTLASKRHHSLGKTEMWYMLPATSPEATVITGFQHAMASPHYQEVLKKGTLLNYLHTESARPGDVFFMPAGRIHSARKGTFFAEIQQCSNITYRIYDFARRDAQGQSRALHIKESIDALDFSATQQGKTSYIEQLNTAVLLVQSNYFVVHKLHCQQGKVTRNMESIDSFILYLCVEGTLQWKGAGGTVSLKAGQCMIVPACIPNYTIYSEYASIALEAYVPVHSERPTQPKCLNIN